MLGTGGVSAWERFRRRKMVISACATLAADRRGGIMRVAGPFGGALRYESIEASLRRALVSFSQR